MPEYILVIVTRQEKDGQIILGNSGLEKVKQASLMKDFSRF